MLNKKNILKVADKLARMSVLHNRAAWRLYASPKTHEIREEENIMIKSARCDAGAQMLARMAHD
jgi:hypothetical protein